MIISSYRPPLSSYRLKNISLHQLFLAGPYQRKWAVWCLPRLPNVLCQCSHLYEPGYFNCYHFYRYDYFLLCHISRLDSVLENSIWYRSFLSLRMLRLSPFSICFFRLKKKQTSVNTAYHNILLSRLSSIKPASRSEYYLCKNFSVWLSPTRLYSWRILGRSTNR